MLIEEVVTMADVRSRGLKNEKTQRDHGLYVNPND